ncbi:endo-1,4-beta-xylanase [Pedobacter sp. UYP24]
MNNTLRKVSLMIALVIFGSLKEVISQVLPKLPTKIISLAPIDLFPNDPIKNYLFSDRSEGKKNTITIKNTAGQPTIFTAEVFSPMKNHYDTQLSWPILKEIKKGDVLLARFSLRMIYAKRESGEGEVNFYVQQSSSPYDKMIMTELGVSPDWKSYEVSFTASHDMIPGAVGLYFSFGSIAQKIEISSIQLLNFRKSIAIKDLPVTKFSYAGRAADAAWRKVALERINRIRKADLHIQVMNSAGRPEKNAKITCRLIESEFGFGTAVSADLIADNKTGTEIYRAKIKELFNTVTIDNGLKWGKWTNPEARQVSLKAVDWINSAKLKLRGHNLVWPGSNFTPSLYRNRPKFGPGFKDSLLVHIREEVTALKGKVVCWDVLNEMLHEKDYFQIMPRNEAAKWFKTARQYDPGSKLFINEYAMLNGPSSPEVIKSYLALISELRSYGAPIDGMGVQGHLGRSPRSPELVLKDLDQLATANLPIEITEFDMNTDDENLQADYTRDFLIACFSHPAVNGFIMWGFWEPAHWIPNASMFRKNWEEKPNAEVWRTWVLNKWKTNWAGKTNNTGKAVVNGFLGKYEVLVTGADGKTKTSYHILSTGGSDCLIRL